MQTIAEVMTRDATNITPQDTIQRAAQLMDQMNIGSLPVCEDQKLVGIVTDRDITVRATAIGKAPDQTQVSDVMSANVRSCTEDQSLEEVMQQMANVQIRRIPVVDQQQRLCGIVSLGDLAAEQSQGVEKTLQQISTPSEPETANA